MISVKKIREDFQTCKDKLLLKQDKTDLEQILELDKNLRELKTNSSLMRAKRNTASEMIGKTKKIGFFKNPLVLPNSIIVTNRKIKKERTEGKFLDDFNRTFGIIASTLTTILIATKL